MNLQELEILKNRFLSELYEVANNHSPGYIYSTKVDPIALGNNLNLSKNQTVRIVNDLVQSGLLKSTIGMGCIMLNIHSIEYLTRLEAKESSNGEYEAFYVSKDEYLKLKKSERIQLPHYKCYIKIKVLNRFTPEVFESKIMLSARGGKDYYSISKANGHSIGIIQDYNNNRAGYFTFDGSVYYKIESLRINSSGDYEFILYKYKEMQDENTDFGKINVENSPNTTIQIQKDSPNSSQEFSTTNTLDNLNELTSCLRNDISEIKKELSEDNGMRLIVAVEYIEELIKSKDVESSSKYVTKIKEILTAIPIKTASSVLSTPIIKMLGL